MRGRLLLGVCCNQAFTLTENDVFGQRVLELFFCEPQVCIAWLASMSLERVDLGKMNLHIIAHEENQDRAPCGKNEPSRMVPFVCRARKHVANAAADDRSDDAEHGCPKHRHMRSEERRGR